MCNKNSSLTCH